MPTLYSPTITTAGTTTSNTWQIDSAAGGVRNLTAQFNFTYGSGGTSVACYLQTSIDGGATWTDIAAFNVTTSSLRQIINLTSGTAVTTFYTATDGALSANTCKDGCFGTKYRVKIISVGTYAGGTTLAVDVSTKLLRANS